MISDFQHAANLIKLTRAAEEYVYLSQNDLKNFILYYEKFRRPAKMLGKNFTEHHCNTNEFKFVILEDERFRYHQPYFLV